MCCAELLQLHPTLQRYGPQSARLLCPRDSPGKNTGVGYPALLQGIFLNQALAGRFFATSTTWEAVEILFNTYFPGGSDGKASACNAGDPGLIPGLGRSPGEGNIPVFLPGEFRGPRSLVGYSPWGHKNSDTTLRLRFTLLFAL